MLPYMCLASIVSHLAGGGWIEIKLRSRDRAATTSHLAGGGWIEISTAQRDRGEQHGPTSQEVGGLK